MIDQGWMIDDGTCDECICGDCWDCAKPIESYGDGKIALVCCCNEGYHIGDADPPEALP